MRASPIFMALIATFVSCMVLFSGKPAEGIIGINWGRQSSQRMIPSMVVDLLLQNGIQEARIFTAADNVMAAFSGSGIGLSISLSNYALQFINSSTVAEEWIQKSVTKFRSQNVDIRFVNVGSEPFSTAFINKTYDNAVDVLKLIQGALNNAGYGDLVKATIPHYSDVLKQGIMKPSDADFKDEIKAKMVEYLKFVRENNAPAAINIYPIHYCHENDLDPDFAFFDKKSKFFVLDDNGLNYTNAFDLLYDSFYWAMKKAGIPDLRLVVGQVGWPTDGYPNADTTNAQRFYKDFLPYVTGNKGTPLRPGMPIDVYIHSISDENRLGLWYGGFQRHWGIYTSDGQPKFKIDLSGKGRDIFPTTAKGITRMPRRWCIFNEDMSDMDIVRDEFDKACYNSDCSSLAPGGSCSQLSFKQNVSYAFNRYFQVKQQRVHDKACNFHGLGKVVPDDPSTGTCIFPIEILSAEKADRGAPFLGINGDRLIRVSLLAMLLPLLSFFLISNSINA
ncbi:O-Glycosyl hydrolase family 17 protein [Forsythia ovata]|uniref:O-Glycosyl hydrolase family 17 protein n=1 Tax=Forsythia ovata TaxID=205694 RepID=A0ABD1SRG6_9LAMI